MGINKVELATGETLIDLSGDTVTPDLLAEGATAHDANGDPIPGTFPISEVDTQADLINRIKKSLDGKASGTGGVEAVDGLLPAGYTTIPCVRFTSEQIIDTGIVCTHNTKIRIVFTRDSDSAMYMYGVVNSGNTASVTAYLASGGSWRFGNKSVARNIEADEQIVHVAIVNRTGVMAAGTDNTYSASGTFETVGSLLIGGCRSSTGAIQTAQFIGKIFAFEMWESDVQVLKLIPAIDSNGVCGFYDMVSNEFITSLTDTSLVACYTV